MSQFERPVVGIIALEPQEVERRKVDKINPQERQPFKGELPWVRAHQAQHSHSRMQDYLSRSVVFKERLITHWEPRFRYIDRFTTESVRKFYQALEAMPAA